MHRLPDKVFAFSCPMIDATNAKFPFLMPHNKRARNNVVDFRYQDCVIHFECDGLNLIFNVSVDDRLPAFRVRREQEAGKIMFIQVGRNIL